MSRSPSYSPERLAYWYFRLNGFLTTENFIVHPDTGSEQRTDADLLAVRFPYRAENLDEPMKDDPAVLLHGDLINIVIAEVKTSECKLNGPWTRPADGNMYRVLTAIGCVPKQALNEVCECLYRKGAWSNTQLTVRLFAVGNRKTPNLFLHGSEILPQEQQLTWSEVISFVSGRFKGYRRQKSSVPQWTTDGRKLQKLCLGDDAEQEIRDTFRLPPLPTEHFSA